MVTTPVKVWTKLLDTSRDDYAGALTTGLGGSTYVSGMPTGSLDGQPNSSGETDAFLTKYCEGAKPWTKLLGTSGTEFATG